MTLYTCADDRTVKAVIGGFEKRHPAVEVDLFRAPTGQLNARIAADERAGGTKADVIWACDPLTMHGYERRGLLRTWRPKSTENIAEEYRSDSAIGVGLLYMVIVSHEDVEQPRSWADLTRATYRDRVAIPDPRFAASALGTLGYFSSAADYGMRFYADLAANGAVQVSTPTDVLTGVAEGTYDVGITLANSAYSAQEKGSPIAVVWPEPGAIAIVSPIATTRTTKNPAAAEEFVEFVASREGQTIMGETDRYPILPDVPGPPKPEDAAVVVPDWQEIARAGDALLEEYSKAFGT